MFNELDFEILNNAEYKEDSVREDIIVPILKKLGYSSSGDNKIRRGITLTHPFVHIGSSKRKINIIPDYILETKNGSKWILDAKAPNENIIKSGNVEQAYSYAINPEIRTPIYALCNGRRFTVFHISEIEPLLDIDVSTIQQYWSKIETILSPLHIEKPYLKEFRPDLGIHLLKSGNDLDKTYYYIGAWVQGVSKINDNLYTCYSVLDFGFEIYAGSFDFEASKLEEFLNSTPENNKEKVRNYLGSAPYRVNFDTKEESYQIIIEAKLSENIITNDNESYLPLKVIKFSYVT